MRSFSSAANQARATRLAAQGVVPAGAFGSAAGRGKTADSAAADPGLGAEAGPWQRVFGGQGKGARDHEQTKAALEAGQFRPGGLGEEPGGHWQTAGKKNYEY